MSPQLLLLCTLPSLPPVHETPLFSQFYPNTWQQLNFFKSKIVIVSNSTFLVCFPVSQIVSSLMYTFVFRNFLYFLIFVKIESILYETRGDHPARFIWMKFPRALLSYKELVVQLYRKYVFTESGLQTRLIWSKPFLSGASRLWDEPGFVVIRSVVKNTPQQCKWGDICGLLNKYHWVLPAAAHASREGTIEQFEN